MKSEIIAGLKKNLSLLVALVFLAGVTAVALSCGGGKTSMVTPAQGMGTVNLSLSDPPSCAAATSGAAVVPVGGTASPAGTFISVFVTIRSIQAHTSTTASGNDPGWQELAPQLVSAPVQVDLLHLPANGQCLLEQLGSTSLPAGDYQQIRLILLANAAPSGPAPSSTDNACFKQLGGDVFNCVVDTSGTAHTLDLSSEANTGLKIPPGQIMGGPIHVAAGQSVDLDIDFNTCASIVQEGNGNFRLKPTLTAGVVSPNMTGISGQIVDSVTTQPIAGAVVTLQSADTSGTDRIQMQQVTDANGHFSFCPLAMGAVFDVVSDALTSSGTTTTAYDVTVVLNVPAGTSLGPVPLVAETPATAGASTGPGTVQGTVTAINGTTGAIIDADVSALQSVTVSSTSHTFTVPLFAGSMAADVMVTSSTSCPTGAPKGAFCASYTLVVPAGNPTIGTFSAGKTTITPPASGDVLYTVEADATNATSGSAMCSPSSQTTSKDSTGMPLKATAGATTTAAQLDFTGCS